MFQFWINKSLVVKDVAPEGYRYNKIKDVKSGTFYAQFMEDTKHMVNMWGWWESVSLERNENSLDQ